MTSVAVLGTGVMGAPMARNLARAGFDVRAYNRTRARAQPLAADGAPPHAAAAVAVRGADVDLTMPADGAAVGAVMADEGALDAMDDGAVWVQASTVGVSLIVHLCRQG